MPEHLPSPGDTRVSKKVKEPAKIKVVTQRPEMPSGSNPTRFGRLLAGTVGKR